MIHYSGKIIGDVVGVQPHHVHGNEGVRLVVVGVGCGGGELGVVRRTGNDKGDCNV